MLHQEVNGGRRHGHKSDRFRTRERNNDLACDPVNEDTTQASNFSCFPMTWTLQTAYTGHVE